VQQLQRRVQAAEAESIILREHVHGGGAGSQADQEVLDLMETQLHKLSDIVRAKEAEITAMRITVQAECAERAELQRVVHRLTGSRQIPDEPGTSGAASAQNVGAGGSSGGGAGLPKLPPSPVKPPSSPAKKTTTNTGGPGTLSYMRRTRHGTSAFR